MGSFVCCRLLAGEYPQILAIWALPFGPPQDGASLHQWPQASEFASMRRVIVFYRQSTDGNDVPSTYYAHRELKQDLNSREQGYLRDIRVALYCRVNDFPGGSLVKNVLANEGSITGSEWAHGGGNSNPFQYFFPDNSMDRGAWCVRVYGVAKSQTWLKQLTTQDISKRFPNFSKPQDLLVCI